MATRTNDDPWLSRPYARRRIADWRRYISFERVNRRRQEETIDLFLYIRPFCYSLPLFKMIVLFIFYLSTAQLETLSGMLISVLALNQVSHETATPTGFVASFTSCCRIFKLTTLWHLTYTFFCKVYITGDLSSSKISNRMP